MDARGLQVTDLHVDLGGQPVVDGVDLEVPAGAWVSVAGPSGSGKSVLLGAIGGLVRSTGAVLVGGLGPHERVAPGIVLQEDPLLPLLSAGETVALPLQVARRSRRDIRAAVGAALGAVGLGDAGDQLVATLSGGQRQRVAIARACAAAPPLLLLDEPTAELDAANRATVLDLLQAEADRGAAVLVVSNDRAILDRSNRVLSLGAGGRLVGRG